MNPDEIETLERAAISLVVQALTDYRDQAATIFRSESDLPQDIAEDVMREAVEEMGYSGRRDRLYGKVDFKKAIYLFLPEPQPVALMLDAKAEKQNGDRTATIQMSQTSMRVKMKRAGISIDEQGRLPDVIEIEGVSYFVVTIIAKFVYEVCDPGYKLRLIVVSCIPNGRLQDRYNPSEDDTIWLAGRDAPTLGEDFRVRLAHRKLRDKAVWRVQTITVPARE